MSRCDERNAARRARAACVVASVRWGREPAAAMMVGVLLLGALPTGCGRLADAKGGATERILRVERTEPMEPPRERAEPRTDPDLDLDLTPCVRAAEQRGTMAAFAGPVDRSFATTLSARVPDVACCFAGDGYEGRMHVRFEPDEALDEARATLVALDGPELATAQSGCVAQVIATWTMSPAPRSDVLRTPLDPSQAPSFGLASVLVAYPLHIAPTETR